MVNTLTPEPSIVFYCQCTFPVREPPNLGVSFPSSLMEHSSDCSDLVGVFFLSFGCSF